MKIVLVGGILLLISSCLLPRGEEVACRSRCGLRLYVSATNPTPSCEAFQQVEDAAIPALMNAAAHDPRLADACRVLSYYGVNIGDPVVYNPMNGERAAGFTFCQYGRIVLGYRSNLMRSGLAHEMAHAAQGCEPVGPVDKKDPDHSNWGPIFTALQDAGFP